MPTVIGTLWPYNGKIPWQKYQCCTLPFDLFLFTQDRAEWFNIALKQRCFRDLKDPRQVEDTIRDFWRKDVDPEKPWMLGNIHWSTETDGDGIGFEKKVVTFFRLKVNSLDPRERLQRERNREYAEILPPGPERDLALKMLVDDEQFFKESAEYTIKKWTARSNPWGLLVVFTFCGEETCRWSMVAFKLSETDLIMEDEQSQRAFERLFGVQTVEQKLKTTKFSMDTWFTGGDFANEAMCQIQTAVRRRLDWFVFENVPEYPTDYLRPLEQKYAYEETLISPQRFGKPMNRLRKYRLYWNKEKYTRKGPCLRQILKLVCPLSELKMDADVMFWMRPSELAH
ncbi:unnamed protein product [Cladocopium goreaui]|uniref:Uncharacterized protein n=1 Tax=Cladocopium goreaui TaxID=2562237 RepID=A0A9P1DU81_9DINO|nr:unnamed protein product [Cladocopium goreaui]